MITASELFRRQAAQERERVNREAAAQQRRKQTMQLMQTLELSEESDERNEEIER